MTDAEAFDVVLGELAALLLELHDLREHVVLVGGLALAVEARAQGAPEPVTLGRDVGLEVIRGYSLDIDLLYLEATGRPEEQLVDALRRRGFARQTNARWLKQVGSLTIPLDLLSTPDLDPTLLPTAMTVAPGSLAVAARSRRVHLQIGGVTAEIPVPTALGFLSMKLASRGLGADRHKDSFDLWAAILLFGPEHVRAELRGAGDEGAALANALRAHFDGPQSPGVADVLRYASTLGRWEQDLLVGALLHDVARATSPRVEEREG